MIYSIKKLHDNHVCFLHFDKIKCIPIYFDNASPTRDKEGVNLYSKHKVVSTLPITWEEFRVLRDKKHDFLTVEVMT